tara:strand:- start:712 stop:1311 length:600 start_codon:yes stop_codon:yes gene_type:complete
MSDYSIYPKAIDGYAQMPLAIDKLTPIKAESVNRLRSSIVNVETTLGIAPHISDFDEVFIDVNQRLDDIEAQFDYSLDRSYDGRGIRSRPSRTRGVGRTITADSGAVRITNSEADSTNTIELIRTGENEHYDPPGGRAIYADGDIQILGRTIASMFCHPNALEKNTKVPDDNNAILAGPVSIPTGIELEIGSDSTLLIL